MALPSLNLPNLLACVQTARQAFRSFLSGANAWLWPNNVGPTAKVIGGAQWSVYQHFDWAWRNFFALFAEGVYLDLQGAMLDLPRKQAAACAGNIDIATTGAAVMAAGGQFQRADGALYTAVSAASINTAGNLVVPVLGPAGLAYNAAENTPMDVVSGLTGDGATGATAAVDANGLTGGLDIEADGVWETRDLGTYRGRILFRKANPTQGGSPADYVQWCGEVPGVTRTFVEKCWAGPGTVRIFPLFDELFASAGGVPDSAHVTLVANYLAPLEPSGSAVLVAAATPVAINITVANLNPSSAQAAVEAELADAFVEWGRVAGISPAYASMPYLASPFTWLADWAIAAVMNAPGVIGADVTAYDTTMSPGQIPVLGTITW
jgi:uncharacterized phage protein gp47/JayE